MTRVLVTTITRTPRGVAMRTSQSLEVELLRVGRGAECELQLPDPRVPLAARTFTVSGKALRALDDRGGLTEALASGEHAAVVGPGACLRVGPYRLEVVDPPEGYDLAIERELVQPLPGRDAQLAQGLSEASLRLPVSRRFASWVLFWSILVCTLIVPAWLSQQHSDALTADTPIPLPQLPRMLTTASWNPGTVASPHQRFADNCIACHSEPFARVKDKDCLGCHEGIGDHVPRALGAVKGLSDIRCATCHQDHNGPHALANQNRAYVGRQCAACHSDIRAAAPQSKLPDASDFAREHPQLQVALLDRADRTGKTLRRVSLDDRASLKQSTGLKYPHDMHIDPRGVDGPQGRKVLDCKDCHQLDATGTQFRPVTMKDHCQSCHELRFDPNLPERQVPHGDPSGVVVMLRDFYSRVALLRTPLDAPLPDQIERAMPTAPPREATRLQGLGGADGRADTAAARLIEQSSCVVCHEVRRIGSTGGVPRWSIAPVGLVVAPRDRVHDWMPKVSFPHEKHSQAACTDCHAANRSSSSEDILMPSIATCRDCHGGNQPTAGKLTSSCSTCHGFHISHNKHADAPGAPRADLLGLTSRELWRLRHDKHVPVRPGGAGGSR